MSQMCFGGGARREETGALIGCEDVVGGTSGEDYLDQETHVSLPV